MRDGELMDIEAFRTAYAKIVAAERQSGRVHGLVPEMPVETTGQGKTAYLPRYRGTVRKIEGDQVFVDFPGTTGMVCAPAEVRPRTHWGCPDAICTWEREHHV